MPVEISYPGVYIGEIPSGVRTIEGVDTSTTAFAGWTSTGPTDRAELVTSWPEFERKFGGLDTRSLLGYSVRQFFNNGGRKAYIVRLAVSAIPKAGDPVAEIPEQDDVVLHPNESDFENALLPAGGIGGLYHLDRVDLFNLLCVPGETNAVTVTALQKFGRDRRAFLIADCAEAATFDDVKSGPGDITGDNSINAAFYFPWILAPDEIQENRPREFPPCGFVAGIYARTDATRGVWKAPAGNDASLTGAVGLSPNKNLNDSQNGVLNPKAINCIRTFPVYGTIVWGSRTLRGSDAHASDWKYVPIRRLALFIEESLDRGLTWTVFEPNDEPLWAQIRLNVGAFMHNLFRQGAFQGATPKDAYFVKCDRETTTQNDVNLGKVNIVVGFAPLKPAEFVIIRLQQMAGHPKPDPDTLALRIVPKATRDNLVLREKELATLDQIVEQSKLPGDKRVGDQVRALFTGTRGTGKTMAAEVIANELGLELYRVNLSSVVSKYIGETEKNLRRLFDAAEESGAVLFFDEADALFGDRSGVKDSHDRYTNLEIDYLLQRLEDYPGLAILATNRKSNIDPVFLRRIRYILNFPFPDEQARA